MADDKSRSIDKAAGDKALPDSGRRAVLTGGMTDAVFAPPGSSVACHFTNLGSVYFNGGAEPA